MQPSSFTNYGLKIISGNTDYKLGERRMTRKEIRRRDEIRRLRERICNDGKIERRETRAKNAKYET